MSVTQWGGGWGLGGISLRKSHVESEIPDTEVYASIAPSITIQLSYNNSSLKPLCPTRWTVKNCSVNSQQVYITPDIGKVRYQHCWICCSDMVSSTMTQGFDYPPKSPEKKERAQLQGRRGSVKITAQGEWVFHEGNDRKHIHLWCSYVFVRGTGNTRWLTGILRMRDTSSSLTHPKKSIVF